MSIKTIKTSCAIAELLSNGILKVTYQTDLNVLEQLQEHVQQLKSAFFEGEKLLILSDIRVNPKSTKATRDYLASEEPASLIQANALLVASGLSKISGNIFLSFSRPAFPIRMFTTEEKAITWLLKA